MERGSSSIVEKVTPRFSESIMANFNSVLFQEMLSSNKGFSQMQTPLPNIYTYPMHCASCESVSVAIFLSCWALLLTESNPKRKQSRCGVRLPCHISQTISINTQMPTHNYKPVFIANFRAFKDWWSSYGLDYPVPLLYLFLFISVLVIIPKF